MSHLLENFSFGGKQKNKITYNLNYMYTFKPEIHVINAFCRIESNQEVQVENRIIEVC